MTTTFLEDRAPSTPTPAPPLLGRIVVVAHAPLASAFVKAANDIAPGSGEAMLALDYETDATREGALAAAVAGTQNWCDVGVLVMTDLPGYTSPGIVAQQLCMRLGESARLLGGLNMPMLLTALMHKGQDLDAAWRTSRDGGRDGVIGHG